MTWVLPAGEYERRDDEATGRRLVVAGTYHRVQAAPVGVVQAMVAVPRGLVAGADVIVSILFVGGAFALLEQLGVLARGAQAVVRRFRGKGLWAVPLVCAVFATFGALENMQEEIIALVPVLLVLGRGLGVDAITMIAASVGAAAVGSAFGPSNPYQAGIALKLAELPLLSGAGLRLAILLVGFVAWVGWTLRHARRNPLPRDVSGPANSVSTLPVATTDEARARSAPFSRRDALALTLTLLPLAAYVVGVLTLDWGFNELSALFFFAALLVAVVSGLGLSGGTAAFLRGMESMIGASVLVGVARSISVVLTDGRVIDTILHGMASPLAGKPPAVAALLMIPLHGAIHVAVPSVSGQAALTMPVLVPLSDLLQLSRQATVVAYQTGAGLADLLIPTNAALMAVLLAAGVPYTRWVAFAWRGFLLLTAIGAAGTLVAASRYS